MKLNTEPKAVLSVCFNPALEKVLYFKQYNPDGVNRAYKMEQFGSGKGVNGLRALRCLGVPGKCATFAGGFAGEKLKNELGEDGIVVDIAGELRCCDQIIDEATGNVSEVIEPSAYVEENEFNAMMALLEKAVPNAGSVTFCGSIAPGVPKDAARRIAALCSAANVPFVLDAVDNFELTLQEKVAVLKVNATEICKMTGKEDAENAAQTLLDSYPLLDNVAITAGAGRAFLLSRADGLRRYTLPKLEKIISPIGCGDCATAIIGRRLAEGNYDIHDAFAEALACASASCYTGVPSMFRMEDAAKILEAINN